MCYVYICVMCLWLQDSLEEVLDVLLANQRALLAERHAQRRFLVQSFQNLQAVINDTFSSIRDCSAAPDGYT